MKTKIPKGKHSQVLNCMEKFNSALHAELLLKIELNKLILDLPSYPPQRWEQAAIIQQICFTTPSCKMLLMISTFHWLCSHWWYTTMQDLNTSQHPNIPLGRIPAGHTLSWECPTLLEANSGTHHRGCLARDRWEGLDATGKLLAAKSSSGLFPTVTRFFVF